MATISRGCEGKRQKERQYLNSRPVIAVWCQKCGHLAKAILGEGKDGHNQQGLEGKGKKRDSI